MQTCLETAVARQNIDNAGTLEDCEDDNMPTSSGLYKGIPIALQCQATGDGVEGYIILACDVPGQHQQPGWKCQMYAIRAFKGSQWQIKITTPT